MVCALLSAYANWSCPIRGAIICRCSYSFTAQRPDTVADSSPNPRCCRLYRAIVQSLISYSAVSALLFGYLCPVIRPSLPCYSAVSFVWIHSHGHIILQPLISTFCSHFRVILQSLPCEIASVCYPRFTISVNKIFLLHVLYYINSHLSLLPPHYHSSSSLSFFLLIIILPPHYHSSSSLSFFLLIIILPPHYHSSSSLSFFLTILLHYI